MLEKQIVNSYEILNIKPFSDLWYKDCFHSSLFPIINKFIGTIKPFMLKDAFIYNYENCSGVPILHSISKDISEDKTLYDILDEIGIECKSKLESSSIIDDICESISMDKPVIAGVDCFYESIRLDAYNKEHIAHSLLIYGFNKEEQSFSIVEHNFRFSIEFTKKIIAYTDIKNAYNGFIKNIDNLKFTKNKLPEFCKKDKKFPSFYSFQANDNLKLKGIFDNEHTYVIRYVKFFIENKELWERSLRNIKEFKDAFIYMISHDLSLIDSNEEFFDHINTIINNKKVEKYIFLTVFGFNQEILSSIENIINSWSVIRRLLAKYTYTKVYNQKHIDMCIKQIISIYDIEIHYYDLISSFYNHYYIT